MRKIRNFFKWGWRCRNIYGYDWTYLLQVMAYQLEDMEKNHRQDTDHCNSDKYAKQLMVCKNLCHRLIDEAVYYEDSMFPDKNFKRHLFRKEYDLELLTNLMKKYLFRWWT